MKLARATNSSVLIVGGMRYCIGFAVLRVACCTLRFSTKQWVQRGRVRASDGCHGLDLLIYKLSISIDVISDWMVEIRQISG
jgi:hypothetical protein